MSLTANLEYAVKGVAYRYNGKINTPGTYYKGSLMAWDTNGYLVKAADTAGFTFAGVLTKKVVVASGETKEVEIEVGIVRIPYGSAAQGDVGEDFYATGDDTVAKSATNISKMGLCVDYETGFVWIDMFRRRT